MTIEPDPAETGFAEFWDSSSLIPVFVEEPKTLAAQKAFDAIGSLTIWWATPTEVASAIERKVREGTLTRDEADNAVGAVNAAVGSGFLRIVAASDAIRLASYEILKRCPLRAADALQLAAALSLGNPAVVFRAEDRRLREAAGAEGLNVPAPFAP